MATVRVFAFALLAAGCGVAHSPSTVDLRGTVIVDGKPVQRGTISFIPEPGTKGAAVGGEILDGQYSVSRVARGTHRVFVQPAAAESREPVTSTDAAKPVASVEPLPARIRNGLVTTVTENGELDIRQ